MSKLAKALTAAAGNAAGESLYVEDVFSTYLYTGTGAAQTITNGIDLDGEGGLVWIKGRSAAGYNHTLMDTERSGTLFSDTTQSANDYPSELSTYNSDGFTTSSSASYSNVNGTTYASWTFRKAEKFFDVVTYTGTGLTRTISHNLNSEVGFMVIKRLDSSGGWIARHRTFSTNENCELNNTNASFTASSYIQSTTDTTFTIGNNGDINQFGSTYVAYLFAHDAGGFGGGGSESIIKCGSYTGTGAAGLDVDLGFEPQWILIKNVGGGHSAIYDVMRQKYLAADLINAEASFWAYPSPPIMPRATGITIDDTNITVNASGNTYIYIAIRRPMKTPESGTEVYQTDTLGGTLPNPPAYYSGFAADWSLSKRTSASGDWFVGTRLTQGNYLKTNTTDAEVNEGTPSITAFDYSTGVRTGTTVNSGFRGYMFKRATGFFDVVAYTGTSTIRQQEHNLGVAPEFVIVKGRNFASHWFTYHIGQTGGADAFHSTMRLNLTEASFDTQLWKNYDFNESTFSLDSDNGVNGSGNTYIAYLFATLDGVSKVGSYTGTGSNVDVDCGFSAGARFILIKRTDSTGDWYVWDSVRGIVAGNDPYLLLNSTAAEVTSTDYIDPLSSGFTVTSSAPAALNASGGSYIFLAIS